MRRDLTLGGAVSGISLGISLKIFSGGVEEHEPGAASSRGLISDLIWRYPLKRQFEARKQKLKFPGGRPVRTARVTALKREKA